MASRNGITNIEIEKLFDDETNKELKRNFMGVYSLDSITKYVNFYNIKKKEQSIHLRFWATTEKINEEHIGGAFLIFMQKKIYCYLIVLDLLGLNSLL